VDWLHSNRHGYQWWAFVNGVMNRGIFLVLKKLCNVFLWSVCMYLHKNERMDCAQFVVTVLFHEWRWILSSHEYCFLRKCSMFNKV
jgi:hypothetical protein